MKKFNSPIFGVVSYIVCCLCFITKSNAQIHVTAPMTGNYTSGQYYNSSSITILPNTIISPGTGQSVRIYIDGCIPFANNLSQDQNYVLTLIPRGANYDPNVTTYKNCDVMQMIQYYDGLGRRSQLVKIKASPLGNDIVQSSSYDQYGREDKAYLPYVTMVSDGSYKTDALTSGQGVFSFYNPTGSGTSGAQQLNGVVVIPTPYAQTIFETSPLSRVKEQGAPGSAWQPASSRTTTGRTIVSDYMTNNNTAWGSDNTTSRQVLNYSTTINTDFSQTLTYNSTYADNQLAVTIVKDENWVSGRAGTVEEYKDKEGRVILKRAYNQNGATLEKLSTYYVYDILGNLAFVLPPGAEPDNGLTSSANQGILNSLCYQYQYDKLNRLVNKALPGKDWEEMIYNKLDQVIFTQDGNQRNVRHERSFIKYDELGRVIMTGIETNHTTTRAALQAVVDAHTGLLWETRDASGSNFNGYTTVSLPSSVTNLKPLQINYYDSYSGIDLPTEYAAPSGSSTETTGMLTASKTAVINADGTTYGPALWKAYYYDDKGRNTATFAQHYLGGAQHVNNYDLITSTYSFTNQLETTTKENYKNLGTTKTHLVTVGDIYSYDHMDRKLKTTETITGNSPVILSQLEYNEVGQLKSKKLHSTNSGGSFLQAINYTYNERGWLSNTSAPVFAMQLKYNDGTAPQYNGNIANQYWGPLANPTLHNYGYAYDNLNRIVNGVSDESFNEALIYDKMGNISSLTRNPMGTNTYTYTGNQLTGISGFLNGSFTYDDNGNQKTDNTKGVQITYNTLNLPASITKASTSEIMNNTWLADGSKISKVVGGLTREYIGGIEYNNGSIEFIQTEEGRAVSTGGGYSYDYMIKDHLGNIRVLLKQDGSVLETSDYYPFGLQVNRSGNTTTSPENRYKYNGKEIQTELGLGQYDYGARFYDPVIGRWGAVDPHAENYQNWTPYNYVANNPMLLVDPNGMDWFYHSADGKADATWQWHEGSTYNTGLKDDNGNNITLQGQQAVVVFNGSVKEKLGSKSTGDAGFDGVHKNGYIDGHGAVTAKVTVYGPGGRDDISHYTGYTMSSDPGKYGVVADGDYNVNYDAEGKNGGRTALQSNWAVNGRGRVPNYWSNPLNPNQIDDDGHYYSMGIFIHSSNRSGYAGLTKNPRGPVSAGCLLISPKDWKNFNNQLKGVNNFLLQIRRDTSIPYRNSQMAPAYNYFNFTPY